MCPWLATTTTSHRLTFGLTTNVCLHRVPRTISPPYSVKQHTHTDTHTHIVDSKEKEKQKQFEYEPVVARWPPPPPSPPPLPPLRWRKNCDDAVAIKRPAKTRTQKKKQYYLATYYTVIIRMWLALPFDEYLLGSFFFVGNVSLQSSSTFQTFQQRKQRQKRKWIVFSNRKKTSSAIEIFRNRWCQWFRIGWILDWMVMDLMSYILHLLTSQNSC